MAVLEGSPSIGSPPGEGQLGSASRMTKDPRKVLSAANCPALVGYLSWRDFLLFAFLPASPWSEPMVSRSPAAGIDTESAYRFHQSHRCYV
jgi:hypothetical protein